MGPLDGFHSQLRVYPFGRSFEDEHANAYIYVFCGSGASEWSCEQVDFDIICWDVPDSVFVGLRFYGLGFDFSYTFLPSLSPSAGLHKKPNQTLNPKPRYSHFLVGWWWPLVRRTLARNLTTGATTSAPTRMLGSC